MSFQGALHSRTERNAQRLEVGGLAAEHTRRVNFLLYGICTGKGKGSKGNGTRRYRAWRTGDKTTLLYSKLRSPVHVMTYCDHCASTYHSSSIQF